MIATVVYLVPFIVFGSEAVNRFVDFSLGPAGEEVFAIRYGRQNNPCGFTKSNYPSNSG